MAAGSAFSSCDNTTFTPPYGATPPIPIDGGEGAEDAASEASDGRVVNVDAEGGGVADGSTIDAEGDAGGAD